MDSLRQYRESVSHIKAQVASVLAAPAAPASSTGAPPAPANAANTLSPEERKRKQIVGSTAVSKKFMVRMLRKRMLMFMLRRFAHCTYDLSI